MVKVSCLPEAGTKSALCSWNSYLELKELETMFWQLIIGALGIKEGGIYWPE